MGRKKKTESTENKTIKLEKINSNKKYNVSDGFYYILGIVLSLVLIFATEELLSTVNYLFVVIFSIIAVIKIINFMLFFIDFTNFIIMPILENKYSH